MKKLFFTFIIISLASGTLYSRPVEPVSIMDVPMVYNPPVIDGIMDNVYSNLQTTEYINTAQLDNWEGETDYKLDVSTLNPGTYILVVHSESGTFSTRIYIGL